MYGGYLLCPLYPLLLFKNLYPHRASGGRGVNGYVAVFRNDFIFSGKPFILSHDKFYFMGGGTAGGL